MLMLDNSRRTTVTFLSYINLMTLRNASLDTALEEMGRKTVVKYAVEFHIKSGYTRACLKLALRAGKENTIMPNIKPISDLRNYSDVLRDVSLPSFLPKTDVGAMQSLTCRTMKKCGLP